MLSECREHVKHQPICVRIITRDEFYLAIHQGGDKRHVASKPVELRNDECRATFAAFGKCCQQLGTIYVLLPTLDFGILGEHLTGGGMS